MYEYNLLRKGRNAEPGQGRQIQPSYISIYYVLILSDAL